MIDCLLIVVSYRSARDVATLVAGVPAAVGAHSWHAMVVNNDPSENLTDVIGTHTSVTVVDAGANLGYAGGINLALSVAPPSTWTIFLNPDLSLHPGAITRLVAAAGYRDAAVPLIRDGLGRLQRSLRREPAILGSLGDAFFGNRWRARPAVLSETVHSPQAYTRVGVIDWATGAALAVPTPVVNTVGPWDETRFFLYSEETDYCRRLRELGSRIRFVPDAVVNHRGGGSGSSDDLHALLEVNRVRYFRKWHRTPATVAFAAVVVLNNGLRCPRYRSRAALKALLSPAARASLPGGQR